MKASAKTSFLSMPPMSNRPKVLLIQPSLQPPGGGNGVAAWMMQALKEDYHVAVLTYWPIDLIAINRYYGTTLTPEDFTAHCFASSIVYRILDQLSPSLSLLKTSLLLRKGKQIQSAYDILISVNNEADFGRRGIQYVHFPWAYHPRPQVELRWYHLSPAIVDAYYWLCVRLSGFSFARMKQNLTLVNSNWTAAKVTARHGIGSVTLYPPVPGVFPTIPWREKEDGFVCIGRISPEKELDKIIDILAAVRAQGRATHLHIIGTPDKTNYYAHIRRRVQENAAWISLNEHLSREELVQLVAQHRYGIHGMSEEHFGMAVAEIVQGGCIVFVPQGGGQVEIIGDQEQLRYRTADEAVTKITQVLDSAELQQTMRSHLASRKTLFSIDTFLQQFRRIVQEFVRT